MIKIRLEKWGKTILMQVLEQSEDITHRGGGVERVLASTDTFSLRATCCPALADSVVYVRGSSKAADYNVVVKAFNNQSSCNAYYAKVVELFEAYNNRHTKPENTTQTIFELK